jgi:hypothetical protein
VHTATEEVFERTPALVRYADALEPRALAEAIEAAARARVEPGAAPAREAFLRRYDWRRLAAVALEPAAIAALGDRGAVNAAARRRG